MGHRLLALLTIFTPQRFRPRLLRWVLGWDVAPSAKIGLSVFLGVRDVRIGPEARIGPFNIFRNLECIELGAHSRIGRFNWVTSATAFARAPRDGRGTFALGDHAALMSRHFVDCSGSVRIGDFSTVAGVRSTILTHQVDTDVSKQVTSGVLIGDYCLISSNVSIAPGAKVPDRCVVAMGAVVAGDLGNSDTLYAGIPARPIRATGSGKYFARSVGHVEPDG